MLQPRKRVSAKMAKEIADRKNDTLLKVFHAIEERASEGRYDVNVVKYNLDPSTIKKLKENGYEVHSIPLNSGGRQINKVSWQGEEVPTISYKDLEEPSVFRKILNGIIRVFKMDRDDDGGPFGRPTKDD